MLWPVLLHVDRTRKRRGPALIRPVYMVGLAKQRCLFSHRKMRAALPIARQGRSVQSEWDSGCLAARPVTRERSPTDRLRPAGTSVPPARPREGLLMMAMPHRREATWQTRHGPTSARRSFASARMGMFAKVL